MFRKMVLFFTVLMMSLSIYSGEIKTGSVPGSVVYQGRVEKDNAPLNGLVHIIFKIYQYQTGGTPLWTSEEFLTEAKSGIFSITFQPPIDILSKGNQLYLEVVIEGEALSPREAIESVVYSLVAKKLEDGSSVHFSSITVGRHSVVDTSGLPQTPTAIIIDGGIYTNRVCFTETKGCLVSNDIGTITGGELSSPSTSYIIADNGNNGNGGIIFRIFESPKAIITHSGNFGVGVETPTEKLVVGGNSIINNDLTVYGNLYLSGVLNNGVIKGLNNDQINIGSANDRIDFVINGSTTITVNGDRLGIGVITPSEALDVNGNIKTNSIMTGSLITISNEIKSSSGENLIIQNSNLANVGIGTDTPKAKLHVGGSIIADLGISASTATFTSDVEVLGDFSANSFGRKVSLSSTTIYGGLNVIGQFSLNNDEIATRGSTQTFTGQNTFLNQLLISSNIFVSGAVGIGADGLRYTNISPSYLQIGDSYVVSSTATLYMSAGANANSNINFYRGTNKIASLGTDGNNIQLKYSNSNTQRVYLDNSYFKLYKSTVVISPSASDTSPAIYVDGNSNVGIGTLSSSQERLNVAGKIKLNGLGSGIVFDDGTILTSSNSISVGSIYNPGTVFITANSDNSGSNDSMYLNMGDNTAIFIDNASKVGIGTIHPLVALDIMGGDVKIGNTAIYSPIRNGNLMVEGDVVVDGTFKQRSSIPVEFTSLSVSQNVYLSTSAGYNTGIGNQNPQHKLDVTGDINLTGDLRSNGNIILTSARGLENLSSISSAGTINFSALQPNRLVATNGSKNLTSSITSSNLASSVNGITGSAGNLVFSTAPTLTDITITGWGNFSGGITASSGTFTNTDDYSIITSSGIKINSPGIIQIGGLAASSLVATDGSKNLTNSITSANLALSVNGITGSAGNLVFSTAPTLTDITITGWGNFSGGITTSSGTFTNTGNYSIKTSSGINISAGTINLNNSARIKNSPNPQENQDVATKWYVDQVGGGADDSGAWVKGGNSIIMKNRLGSTNNKDVIFIRDDSEQFRMESSDVNFLVKVILNNGLDIPVGSLNISGLTGNRLVATDASKNLTNSITSANLASSVNGITGTAGNLVFSNAPTLSNITVSGWGNFSGGITASSGTFTNTGDYSIKTSSGMNISAGTINLNNSAMIKNSPNPQENQDVATKWYVDQVGGGGSETGAWVKTGNTVGSTYNKLGSTNSQDVSFIRNNNEQFKMGSSGVTFNVTSTFSKGINTSTITVSNFTTAGFIKNNTSGVLSGGNTIVDSDIPSTIVRTSRSINTTSPLSGGGNLSADRTLSVGGLSSMGTGNYVVGVNNLASVWEYKNIVGVTNEIDITHSAGQIQIGLVNPLSVAKGGTGLSSAGGSSNKVLLTADGSTFSVGTISNNYLSVGSYTNITGVGTLTAGTWNANLIGLAYGGTNKNLTPANGGVVWTDSDSMEVTSAGTAGQVLLSGGAASPTWGTLGLNYGGTGANLSGASNLPIKKSGTYLTAAAIDLSGSEVSNTLPASRGGTGISGAGGTANRVLLTTDGNNWTAGQVNLNSVQTTGTLPVSRGGTNNTTYTSNQFLWYDGTKITHSGYSNSNFANASHNHSTSDITSGTLTIARGGTNATSFTQNNAPIIYDGSKLISYNGFNGSFTVAKSTDSTQGCMQLTYQYGILASTATVTCP
ncbi:MAG: hypothetical protein GX445_04365 [Elusimicrobia bacterium]|nr:hypothetical protein [Elusimicrobiota bacterium]